MNHHKPQTSESQKSETMVSEKKILRVLNGETLNPPPIWLMRQAGRYLPEYRETRAKAGDFLSLCYTPELAAEVTLQPIRRFGFDAAILFADILLIPQALGQDLWFEKGEGPRLTPIEDPNLLKPTDKIHETLNPIYETVSRVSKNLAKNTTLIGFAGAPWTVATYMIAGRGTPDQVPALNLMKENNKNFNILLDKITESTILYLIKQIESGVEVIKLFDSWANVLDEKEFHYACINPTQKIIKSIKHKYPKIPIIGFPRGVGKKIESYIEKTGIDCIAIDQNADLEWISKTLKGYITIQGNLDPNHMIFGGEKLEKAVFYILEKIGDAPFIFNLGHGITPEADIKNINKLIKIVRREKL